MNVTSSSENTINDVVMYYEDEEMDDRIRDLLATDRWSNLKRDKVDGRYIYGRY